MSVTNRKEFIRRGPSDVFLLNENSSYTITTDGFLTGAASDVHIWIADNELASPFDAALATNWVLLRDTGLSGEAAALAVTAGTKKLLVDVIDPIADGGVVVDVVCLDVLTEDAGMGGLNNQRQKNSSGRRFQLNP
jgi:hypothetical protein